MSSSRARLVVCRARNFLGVPTVFFPPSCAASSPRIRLYIRHALFSTHTLKATENDSGSIPAAPEIVLNDTRRSPPRLDRKKLKRLRIVPASPSYFTAKPRYTDDLLNLQAILRKYQTLPTCRPADAPKLAWRSLDRYRALIGDEPVRSSRYSRMLELLKRLNRIHHAVMPDEVKQAIEKFSRDLSLFTNRPKPILIDDSGRARAVGRRKSSSAQVWLVEGDGEVLVNGKTLVNAFPRLHDRESVIWALKATDRIDKYNIMALVRGGGTTGQAEAITLGVGKALVAHEPLLKPALRKGMLMLHSALASP